MGFADALSQTVCLRYSHLRRWRSLPDCTHRTLSHMGIPQCGRWSRSCQRHTGADRRNAAIRRQSPLYGIYIGRAFQLDTCLCDSRSSRLAVRTALCFPTLFWQKVAPLDFALISFQTRPLSIRGKPLFCKRWRKRIRWRRKCSYQ